MTENNTDIPRKIGRYEIISEIGRGGMATVYLAHDPRFKREVAVKIMAGQLLSDETFRARFEREAQAIAAIEHPAIVPVYDFGEEGDQLYLVMRYMTGGSLSDILDRGPMSFTQAAKIISRLAPALDAIHEHGIIHRDLKPANILFDQYGNAFLSDFGIARLTQATTTLTGEAIVGTPAYMSPEQVRGESNLDGRSDVYALGAILFEMLTGKQPYEATTPMAVALKQITDPVPRILNVKSDLPPECEQLITKAMAKDREQRFSTATGLATAQQEIITKVQKIQEAAMAASAPPSPSQKPVETPLSAQESHPPVTPPPEHLETPPLGAEISSQTAPPPEAVGTPLPAVAATPPPAAQPAVTTPAPQTPGVMQRPLRTQTPPYTPAAKPSAHPPKKRRGFPTWIWLLGGLLIVGGICMLTGFLVVSSLVNGSQSIPPTPGTTPGAGGGSTMGPRYTPGQPYADDFSDSTSGWPSGAQPGGELTYNYDAYYIVVDQPNTLLWGNPGLDFTDITVEVDAAKLSGAEENYYGIICRYQNENNFYLLAINTNGHFGIFKNKDGQIALVDADEMGYSDLIHQGDSPNSLRADCSQNNLILFVNNVQLGATQDAEFSSGDIGLAAAALSTGDTIVTFDNFIAREP